MTRHRAKIVGAILVAVFVVNFLCFAVVAIFLGGDAWNGKIEDGHYYLAQHARLTEVSRAVWIYSYAHVVSVFALVPLMVVGALMHLAARGLLFSKLPGGNGPRK